MHAFVPGHDSAARDPLWACGIWGFESVHVTVADPAAAAVSSTTALVRPPARTIAPTRLPVWDVMDPPWCGEPPLRSTHLGHPGHVGGEAAIGSSSPSPATAGCCGPPRRGSVGRR